VALGPLGPSGVARVQQSLASGRGGRLRCAEACVGELDSFDRMAATRGSLSPLDLAAVAEVTEGVGDVVGVDVVAGLGEVCLGDSGLELRMHYRVVFLEHPDHRRGGAGGVLVGVGHLPSRAVFRFQRTCAAVYRSRCGVVIGGGEGHTLSGRMAALRLGRGCAALAVTNAGGPSRFLGTGMGQPLTASTERRPGRHVPEAGLRIASAQVYGANYRTGSEEGRRVSDLRGTRKGGLLPHSARTGACCRG